MELKMTKSPTREPPPQAKEEPPPRHRNVYDYDGEYEFPVCSIGPRQTFQHGRRDVRFAPPLVGAGEKLRREGEARLANFRCWPITTDRILVADRSLSGAGSTGHCNTPCAKIGYTVYRATFSACESCP
jgi:hypothetical protein